MNRTGTVVFLMLGVLVLDAMAGLGPWQPLGGESSGSTCMSYDAGTRTLLVGSLTGFLYYSVDQGVWTSREQAGAIGREVWSILAHPTIPGRIITGRQNAFFKGYLELTPDWGVTRVIVWASQGGKFTDLEADPFDPQTMFACGWHDITPGDLLRSRDGGITWSPLPNPIHVAMTGIAVDRLNPGRLYVSGSARVTMSTNGGDTWVTASQGLPPSQGVYCVAVSPHDGSVLLCSNDSGIYRSSNMAGTWTQVHPRACSHLAFNPGVPGMAAAVTFSPYQVLVSWDWGLHWTDATSTLSGLPLVDLVFSADGTRLYVTSSVNGVFASTVTPPIQLQVTVAGGEVRLSWTSDGPFSVYHVYRSPTAFGPFTRVASTPELTYAEPVQGEAFFYHVTGENPP